MKKVIVMFAFTALAAVLNSATAQTNYNGTFANDDASLVVALSNQDGLFIGTITAQGKSCAATAVEIFGVLGGTYTYNGNEIGFAMAQDGNNMILTAEGYEFTLHPYSGQAKKTTTATAQKSTTTATTQSLSATARQYQNALSGRQLLYMNTSGGSSDKWSFFLYADGTFRYRNETLYSSNGYGSNFSYNSSSNDTGEYRFAEQDGVTYLCLTYQNGESSYYALRTSAKGEVLLNNERYFNVALNY
jgi:hypothetical protein